MTAPRVESGRVDPSAAHPARIWRALLWGEWYAHSRVLLVFFAGWLVAVWTLPLFTHSGWILLIVFVYAMVAGSLYGGGDTIEGSEEFTFSLPSPRTERFVARFIVGSGTLLALCLMNVIALGFDLPQLLAGLYVRGGLAGGEMLLTPGLMFCTIVAVPLCVFSIAFCIAAVTHSRFVAFAAAFWGALAGLALLQIAFWYEELVYESIRGAFAAFLLLLTSAVVVVGSGRRYARKQVAKASPPVSLPVYWWLWTIAFVVALGLACALVSSLVARFPALFER